MLEKIINGLIGFLFGLLAFWIKSFFEREKKSLTANIMTFSLLSLPDSIREHIVITFSGTPVSNMLVHRITFWNSGNTVIENHPITISTNEHSDLLYVDKGDRFTISDKGKHSATLTLTFLNPKESKHIQVHTTGDETAASEITVFGEGPGMDFKAGEKVLPVIRPDADPKEIRQQIFAAVFGKQKKFLIWLLVFYVLFFGAMMLLDILGL